MDMRLYLFLFLLLVLAACDRAEKPAPPTIEESQRLDNAAAMLDNLASEERAANEEGPANASAPADPSNQVE